MDTHSHHSSSFQAPPPPVAKKSLDSTTQSAFIQKLYNMLEDDEIQSLISWDASGAFFLVHDPTEFSKVVLPQYFKHNNFASFVRQLNMYGFNKLNAGVHVVNSTNGSSSDVWEFKHPDFKRGDMSSLTLIKRKSSKSAGSGVKASQVPYDDYNGNKDDRINFLNHKIQDLEQKLEKLHESHNLLWSETVACRVLQSKHHQVIGNAISFLGSIYKDDSQGGDSKSKKRKLDVDVKQAEVAKLNEGGGAPLDQNKTGHHPHMMEPLSEDSPYGSSTMDDDK